MGVIPLNTSLHFDSGGKNNCKEEKFNQSNNPYSAYRNEVNLLTGLQLQIGKPMNSANFTDIDFVF